MLLDESAVLVGQFHVHKSTAQRSFRVPVGTVHQNSTSDNPGAVGEGNGPSLTLSPVRVGFASFLVDAQDPLEACLYPQHPPSSVAECKL